LLESRGRLREQDDGSDTMTVDDHVRRGFTRACHAVIEDESLSADQKCAKLKELLDAQEGAAGGDDRDDVDPSDLDGRFALHRHDIATSDAAESRRGRGRAEVDTARIRDAKEFVGLLRRGAFGSGSRPAPQPTRNIREARRPDRGHEVDTSRIKDGAEFARLLRSGVFSDR
jgi:hypothetical protein